MKKQDWYKLGIIFIIFATITLFTGPLFSITGDRNVLPSTAVSYDIAATFTAADPDWSDGAYSEVWGSWALVDSSQNVITSANWQKLTTGSYTTTASFTSPASAGNYYLIATVMKYDYTWNTATKAWSSGTSTELIKEGDIIHVAYSAPGASTTPSWTNILQNIWTWILELLGLI